MLFYGSFRSTIILYDFQSDRNRKLKWNIDMRALGAANLEFGCQYQPSNYLWKRLGRVGNKQLLIITEKFRIKPDINSLNFVSLHHRVEHWIFSENFCLSICRMETLKNTVKLYKLFGYCRYGDSDQKVYQCIASAINPFFTLNVIVLVLVSLEYIYSHSDETDNSLYCVLQLIAMLDNGGAHIMLSMQKNKFRRLFANCQSLVNERKFRLNRLLFHYSDLVLSKGIKSNPNSAELYATAERNGSPIAKYFGMVLGTTYYCAIISSLIHVIVFKLIIEHGQSDPATWYIMFKMR